MHTKAFDELRSILLRISSAAAMTAAYSNWSDDFSRREVREAWEGKKPRLWSLDAEAFATMTHDEREILGFGRWSHDSELWLIPLWAWNHVSDGVKLTSISGDTKIKGSDKIDTCNRFGCMAWGFDLKREA